MPTGDPSPQQTLALILGASSFRRAPKLAQGRAFNNSAQDFKEYLVSPKGMGIPDENINWLFDDSRSPSDQLGDIRDFLETRTAELTGKSTPPQDLILYYVGHGLFSGSDQTYCLAIRATDERSEGLTSIRATDLASIIKSGARFLRKFLIFDCCFSSAAYREFQSSPLTAGRVKIMDELPARGTTMLCSASSQDPSLAPQGLSHTMFSDGLLGALQHGHPSLGPRLSLSELGDLVKARLKESYPENWVRPEVHSPDQREGDVASVCLFPNPVFAAAAPSPAVTPRQPTIPRPPHIPPERPGIAPAPIAFEGGGHDGGHGGGHGGGHDVGPVAKPPRVDAPHLPPKVVAAQEPAARVAQPRHAIPAHPEPPVRPAPAPSTRSSSHDTTSTPVEEIETAPVGFFRGRAVIIGAIALAVLASVIVWYVKTAPDRKTDEGQLHMQNGDARRNDGKFDEAIAQYRQSLAIWPVPAAYEGLGFALLAKDDTTGAIDSFRSALKIMPDYARFHYDLALALAKHGDLTAAKAEFAKVTSNDSSSGLLLPESADLRNIPLTVAIDKDQLLTIAGQSISGDVLGDRITDIYKNLAERSMCIAPETPETFLRVMDVAKIARKSGIDHLCIIPPGSGTK